MKTPNRQTAILKILSGLLCMGVGLAGIVWLLSNWTVGR